MDRFAQDVFGSMNVPMFFVSTGTGKDSGRHFSSLLADRESILYTFPLFPSGESRALSICRRDIA
jgi:hypothetical protein